MRSENCSWFVCGAGKLHVNYKWQSITFIIKLQNKIKQHELFLLQNQCKMKLKKNNQQCLYSNEWLMLSHKNGILGSFMSHLN